MILFPLFSKATSLNIGILTEFKINSLLISSNYGDYDLYGDGLKIMEVKGNTTVSCLVQGDSVQVKKASFIIGKYKVVKLIGKNPQNSFNIKPMSPEKPLRVYDNNLEMTVRNRYFRLSNRVNIDFYVAGVVEAENGIKQNFEYYKMKSIICRTYALSNLRRHEADGYNLCDQVHCQVYKAKNRLNDDIILAAKSTTSMVIVDSELKLITAAFHSNCGGQTLNSEDVWLLPTSYLKSIQDTFCLDQPNARWEYRIPVKDWLGYLKKHKQLNEDSLQIGSYFSFTQNGHRETDYVCHDVKIPLKLIRNDFKLRSTYFGLEKENDSIVLKGKGYGHGIGLCQEGAMKMASMGYRYYEILHYYYKDIHIVDLSVLDFFRAD